jgi:hypothetical protein
MTHDPICPQGEGASISTTPYGLEDFLCLCELIGKVRAETREAEWERRREAERIVHERHSAALREAEKRAERADGRLVVATLLAWREGEAAMLAKCITAVENLPDWALNIDDVIEALRSLQEKP